MKLNKIIKSKVLICLVLFAYGTLINAQGIAFKYGKWDNILKKAKQEKKLIFIDVFTTWCAPCKVMSKNIFPLADVGNYFNKNFINFKIDAERGEGIKFAKKYAINAYPSLLFINAKGEMVNKNIGAINTGESLIQFAKKTLENRNDSKYGNIKNAYIEDKSDFNNFKKYAALLKKQGDIPALRKVFQEFANKDISQLTVTDKIINFLNEYKDFINPGGNFFKHLSANFNTYHKVIGSEKTNNLFKGIYANINTVYMACEDKKVSALIASVNKDRNLEENFKNLIIAQIGLYKSQFEFENAMNGKSLNYNSEEEFKEIALNYRNNIVRFVEQFKEQIDGQNLVSFAKSLQNLYQNTSNLSTQKEDKKNIIKLWLEAVNKGRDPMVLAQYASIVFQEGFYLLSQEQHKLSNQKRKKAIQLIEEAVKKERLNNSADEQNLDYLYQVESLIKKGYQVDPPLTLYQLKEVLGMIKDYYVDPVFQLFDEKKYINHILSNLDSYSRLIPYDQLNRQFASFNGDLGGVGMRLNLIDDKPTVVALTTDAPAHKAGIKLGDIVISANNDNNPDNYRTTEDITSKIIGKVGSSVPIKIMRDKSTMDFNLKRKILKKNSVEAYYMVNKNTGYIKLGFFRFDCHQQVKDAIINLKSNGMTQLVLDLTDNPGGIRDEAIKIADEFISGDKVIVTERNKKGKDVHRANPKVTGSFEKGKMIVMINEHSASASELLSGALQDYDRAYFVGRKSFGKGLVQATYTLNDGTGLVLTGSRFLFPSGRCPQIDYPNKTRPSREELIQSRVLNDEKANVFIGFPEFKTALGRTVYGNSGVMPEFFVPLDLRYENSAYKKVQKNRLVFQFVTNYLRDSGNQKKLKKMGKTKFINKFKINKSMWQKFIGLSNRKIPMAYNKLIEIQDLLKNKIKAEIAIQLWNDKNIYQKVLNLNRNIFFKAVDSFKEVKS